MRPTSGKPLLGVLGGMGPAATADFLLRLARLTPAKRDQDHVPTLVYSDPAIPDRSDAILGVGPSPLEAMMRGIEFLNDSGCQLIAIPCNTAHYWYSQLSDFSRAPILHIAEATATYLMATGAQTVGLMATDGTCAASIYQSRLVPSGMSLIDLSQLGPKNPIMQGIRAYKASERSARDLLIEGAVRLKEQGADSLIIGCTDISAALADTDSIVDLPVVDASTALAQACLDSLLGHTSPSGTNVD